MDRKYEVSLESFYNNQYKRDADLLTIPRKREAEMKVC